ncbi:hypothetical protein HZB02_01035 [Candidatus Woesearchaeota archaeon]|nr:hypothetical protein [Candidatus Woesearchaeota archaeon]
MDKKLLIGCCILLLIPVVAGLSITTDTPTIAVQFTETVNVTLAQLLMQSPDAGVPFLLQKTYDQARLHNHTLKYRPLAPLPDGTYAFRVAATDLAGNPLRNGYKEMQFDVDTSVPRLLAATPINGTRFTQPNVLFSLQFSEPVIIERANITKEGPVTNKFTSTDGITQTATITMQRDGDKEFYINVSDPAGHAFETKLLFTMDAYPLQIYLSDPSTGYTNRSMINVTFETDAPASCNSSMVNWNLLKPLATSDGLFHRLENVTFDTTTRMRTLYTTCKDRANQEEVNATFTLFYDNTPPQILSAAFLPATITDPEALATTLTVTTDEPSLCRYATTNTTFGAMARFSTDDDESSTASYRTAHTLTVDQNLQNNKTYTYYILCKNRANMISEKVYASFRVAAERNPKLTILSPPPMVNTTKITFNISTNLAADHCYYSRTEDTIFQGTPMTMVSSKGFTGAELDLYPGSYTYYFGCTFTTADAPLQQTAAYTFVIDTTPPSKPFVTDRAKGTNNTECSPYTNKLYGAWNSTDNESGITGYQYEVIDFITGETALTWTQTTLQELWISDLSLKNFTKYQIKAKARNGVGLWSSAGSSDGVTINPSCMVFGCDNGIKDNNETDIDCGGSCGPCDEGKICHLHADCISGYCTRKNTSTVSQCAKATCDDGVKNEGEVAIDCGGPCSSACLSGETCEYNSDCSSGLCDQGVCVEDTCKNTKKDSAEADIDCGGACSQKCAIGDQCVVDHDCTTASCQQGTCQVGGSKDTDGDGMPDSWETMYSLNPNDPHDAALDSDGDGFTNLQEYENNTNPLRADGPSGKETDSDHDGMPDSWEERYGLNISKDDSKEDPDKDGLTNLEEFQHQTNPTTSDTDGDGMSDGDEVRAGRNPNGSDVIANNNGAGWVWIVFGVLVIAAFGAGGYYFYTAQQRKSTTMPKDTFIDRKPWFDATSPFLRKQPPLGKQNPVMADRKQMPGSSLLRKPVIPQPISPLKTASPAPPSLQQAPLTKPTPQQQMHIPVPQAPLPTKEWIDMDTLKQSKQKEQSKVASDDVFAELESIGPKKNKKAVDDLKNIGRRK